MEKSYIENKKQKLQNELLTIKEKALEILSKFETTNSNYDIIKDVERLKEDIENEDWYIITTSVRFLRIGLVYLEKNEELKERNLVLWKELDNLCSSLHKTFSELNSCDSIMDNGPLCVENKTIVITDPCYIMKDRDETNRPKWDDYFSHKNMRDYPDYNKEKDTSKQFKKDHEKYDKAYKKWDEENPEDWERCDYGDNMEILEGLVEAIIFKSDDSGYIVAKITANKEVVTIVGIMPLIKEGQQIEIKGNWINHKQFGRQFSVEEYKEVLPTSAKEIEKYLSTGIIHGIGPVTAKKIVKAFGVETLDILDNNIERLKEVEGIGEKKFNIIYESFIAFP